jgi:ParB-like nuclease family protein
MTFTSTYPRSTGLPLLDAQSDFLRARRAHRAVSTVRWLRRRSCGCLRALRRSATLAAGPARLEVVALRAIVGTLDPTSDFDSDFRPASDAVRWRWERIALAHRSGEALPPVVLRRQPDGYYVIDGRHRVSVAQALGHRDIDAWVTGAPSDRANAVTMSPKPTGWATP